MNEELQKRLKNVKMFILDVDGVLTNGTINYDDEGREIKVFDVRDGFGIVLLHKFGIKTAIISARKTKAVDIRATDLGIEKIYQNARPKTKAYEEILVDYNLKDEDVAFMGDDLPDLCLINRVGCAITPQNGHEVLKEKAHYVTQREGGRGAVREVIEMLLKAQGFWDQLIEESS